MRRSRQPLVDRCLSGPHRNLHVGLKGLLSFVCFTFLSLTACGEPQRLYTEMNDPSFGNQNVPIFSPIMKTAAQGSKKSNEVLINTKISQPQKWRNLRDRPASIEKPYDAFSDLLIVVRLVNISTMMSISQKALLEETLKQFIETNFDALHRVTVKVKSQMVQRKREHTVSPEANAAGHGGDDNSLNVLFSVYGFYEGGSNFGHNLEADIQYLIRNRREVLRERIFFLHEYDEYFRDITGIEVLDSSEFENFSDVEGTNGGFRNSRKSSDGVAIFGVIIMALLLMFVAVASTKLMLYKDALLSEKLSYYDEVDSDGRPLLPLFLNKNNALTSLFKTKHGKRGKKSVKFSDVDISYYDNIPESECVRLECAAPRGNLGVAIRETKDYPIIFALKPGGPMSEKLKPMDKIVAIDDVDTRGMTGDDFTNLVQQKSDVEKMIYFMRRTNDEDGLPEIS